EAVEQCHGMSLPEVADLRPLDDVLAGWPEGRTLYFCDERRDATALAEAAATGPAAILIGPEGGFSDAEREKLKALPFTRPVSLGPRILRAETAAVAALSQYHSRRS
ncbi:MAG: RsmE family RNA methyltransferase, partial [Alphaproteobacteria bacterium]